MRKFFSSILIMLLAVSTVFSVVPGAVSAVTYADSKVRGYENGQVVKFATVKPTVTTNVATYSRTYQMWYNTSGGGSVGGQTATGTSCTGCDDWSFRLPSDADSNVTVEVWGAGGPGGIGGGDSTTQNASWSGGGGGGGGGYISKTLSLKKNTTYNVRPGWGAPSSTKDDRTSKFYEGSPNPQDHLLYNSDLMILAYGGDKGCRGVYYNSNSHDVCNVANGEKGGGGSGGNGGKVITGGSVLSDVGSTGGGGGYGNSGCSPGCPGGGKGGGGGNGANGGAGAVPSCSVPYSGCGENKNDKFGGWGNPPGGGGNGGGGAHGGSVTSDGNRAGGYGATGQVKITWTKTTTVTEPITEVTKLKVRVGTENVPIALVPLTVTTTNTVVTYGRFGDGSGLTLDGDWQKCNATNNWCTQFTVPPGVSQITVEIWGGGGQGGDGGTGGSDCAYDPATAWAGTGGEGGEDSSFAGGGISFSAPGGYGGSGGNHGGGGYNADGGGGGGGGGGGYTRKVISVTPGTTFNVYAGKGFGNLSKAGTNRQCGGSYDASGGNGGSGAAGSTSSGGAGGAGDGGGGSYSLGGGGGGAGYPSGNGGAGYGGDSGCDSCGGSSTGGANGGNGGAGGGGPGWGGIPGGGGGGGNGRHHGQSGAYEGAIGGTGQVRITYSSTVPNPVASKFRVFIDGVVWAWRKI